MINIGQRRQHIADLVKGGDGVSGEVRTWKDGDYQKQANGQWKKIGAPGTYKKEEVKPTGLTSFEHYFGGNKKIEALNKLAKITELSLWKTLLNEESGNWSDKANDLYDEIDNIMSIHGISNLNDIQDYADFKKDPHERHFAIIKIKLKNIQKKYQDLINYQKEEHSNLSQKMRDDDIDNDTDTSDKRLKLCQEGYEKEIKLKEQRNKEMFEILKQPKSLDSSYVITQKDSPNISYFKDGKIVQSIEVNKITIKNGVEAFCSLVGLQEVDKEFYGLKQYLDIDLKMYGGKKKGVRVILEDGIRAFQGREGIHISPNNKEEVIIHELGHHLEQYCPEIGNKAKAFLLERTKGEQNKQLSKATGINSFSEGEITKTDHFIDAYMGKIYASKDLKTGEDKIVATEIFSMGLQLMYQDAGRLLEGDEQYFKFIYNTLNNGKS